MFGRWVRPAGFSPPNGRSKAFSALVASVIVLCGLFYVGCVHFSHNHRSTVRALSERLDWPHAGSDLKVDPSLFLGRFDNGFAYVLKENHTPKDRVSMHLYVRVGSLNEKDDQQGMAHFLEHMVFNGTVNFEPGELVKFFQRIGMRFGPDANARTGFTQTVFDILLPDGDEKSIKEGFLVLRDYAQGALLGPEEVEKERKVIFSEMRARDTADFRTLKAVFNFQMPEALLPDRFPIGLKETLAGMDAEDMRAFYDGWYRPERMTLVMVGDFETETVVPLVEKFFAGMTPKKDEAPRLPPFGVVRHQGDKAFYHFEKGAGGARISIETIETGAVPPDSVEKRRHDLLLELASRIVQSRLDALVRSSGSLLTSAGYQAGDYLNKILYAEISAHCAAENWRSGMTIIEQQLRQALQYGFLQSELSRAKKDLLGALQKDVLESNSRQSSDVAREIISDLNALVVSQSPEQRLEMLSPMIDAATTEKVHEVFKSYWEKDHRLLIVTGMASFDQQKASPEEQILSAFHESRAIALSAPRETRQPVFPYLPEPESSGEVLQNLAIEGLGARQIVFKNGLNLLYKQTDFEKENLITALSFGGGKRAEPASFPGLADLAEMVVNASGFGGMDNSDLEKALAGKLARIELQVREDRFVLQGHAPARELPLLMQLMYTFIQDPGFRRDAYELVLKRYEQTYESLWHRVEGKMEIVGQRRLAGGDTRFGLPAPEQLRRISLEQIERWFEKQLRESSLELAVVGDFQPESLVDQTARYLSTVPAAGASANEDSTRKPIFPQGRIFKLPVESNSEKSLLVLAYPTDDFWNIQQTRRLNVLADLVSERLRVRLREKLGAVYSPYAFNRPYRAYPGYGLFQIFLTVDPGMADSLLVEVRQIVDRLLKEEIGQDAFERILSPTLTHIKDLRQKNAYWLHSVLSGAARHPEQLDWSRSMESDYAGVTRSQIVSLARRFLVDRRGSAVIISPLYESESVVLGKAIVDPAAHWVNQPKGPPASGNIP